MHLTKNKLHQLFFYTLITFMLVFNGGNYDLYAQFNFIFASILFLVCQRDINYKSHIRKFFLDNKKIIIIYFIFLTYLTIQIIPLPTEFIKIFSPTKYKLLFDLDYKYNFSSISLDTNKSFFWLLNYFSLLLYVLIFKSIFYKERHILRFYFFLSFISFIASIVAVFFYLNGNPNFLFIINNDYPNAATGFFINRTVFACFLILGFIASLEYLNNINFKDKKKRDNFFIKVYVRLFILFITIGIITSFSRLGNFLFLILIIIYLIKFYLIKYNKNKFLLYTLLAIILFDIFILGFFFGGEQLFDRFYFLRTELSVYTNEINQIITTSRGEIAKFSLSQLSNFLIFGYGAGGFEILFKNFYGQLDLAFANHAHSDLIEFIGEFGLIGTFLLLIIFFQILKKIEMTELKNLYLFLFVFLILIFDFSLHIPIIQILLLLLLSIKKNKAIQ
jgi:O-antigen ligase